MIHYCVLSTGSCGNSYVFYDGETSVVVDLGVTYTKFVTQLEIHDIPPSSVKAVFLTHLHPDHVKGVGAVQRKMKVPVYISSTAYHNGKSEIMKQKIDKDALIHFEWGESIDVCGVAVTSFAVSHDSPGASGYSISFPSSSFFILTDTGIIPDEAYSYASLSSVKFIEANYDEDMLLSGPYPDWLKKRISGPYGHLSNTTAVEFAEKVSKRGDQIYFVHPSENNNKTALLKEKAEKRIESGIFLKCCERGEMFEGFID